jgi:Phosphotransferase enzyme family
VIKLSNTQLLRKNLRFAAYSGMYNGNKVFIKVAQADDLRQRLWREASGLTEMYELDPAEFHYKVPKVLYVAEDTLVTTWVKGDDMRQELLDKQEYLLRWDHLNKLIDLYSYMDGRTASSIGTTRTNQPGKQNGIDKSLERIRELKDKISIDSSLFYKIAVYAKSLQEIVENRFTHGDLHPGNILINRGEVPTLVDCESCSFLWPRHYNVVSFVFNYTLNHKRLLEKELNKVFFDYFGLVGVDPRDSVDQINFTASLRCLQCVYENLGNYTGEGLEEISKDKSDFINKCMINILDRKLFIE